DVRWLRQGIPITLGELVGTEVTADKELGGGIDALEVLTFDLHLVADARARPKEHGIEAVGEELVDSDITADVGVADELHAERFELGDVLVDDFLAHLEVGDAVDKDTTGLGPEFVHRNGMALERDQFGHSEPGGAGTDNRNTAAGGLGHVLRQRVPAELLALVVGDEGFELA